VNPKAKRFRINRCVVCGYKYSDNHHLYPRVDGGQETIALCPNHHRYANMFQAVMHSGGMLGEKKAVAFALKYFDEDFNHRVLQELIAGYYYGIPKEEDEVVDTSMPVLPGNKDALDYVVGRLEKKHGRRTIRRK